MGCSAIYILRFKLAWHSHCHQQKLSHLIVGHSAPHCTINQTNLEIWTWPYRRCYNSCSGFVLYSDSLPPSLSPPSHPYSTSNATSSGYTLVTTASSPAHDPITAHGLWCIVHSTVYNIIPNLHFCWWTQLLPVKFSSLHLICRWAQHDSAHYIQYAYKCRMTLLWE